MPVAKPPTKWERFAKAKGISHKTKEKREWDEEKQEWVNRWGRNGKSREGEDQWLHEVKNRDGTSIFLISAMTAWTRQCDEYMVDIPAFTRCR